jgi:hypothetical protein
MQLSRMDAGASGTEGPTDMATMVGPGRQLRDPKQDIVPGGAREHPRTHFSRADSRRENDSVRSTLAHCTKGRTPCLATSTHPGMS